MSEEKLAKNHEGHRGRLRQRFLKGGRPALPDYELLELLLTYVIPRKDTKPIARDLLRRYRSFNSVLSQSKDRLEAVDGMGEQTSTFIHVIRAVESRGALDVASRVLQRSSAVFRYAIHTGRATYNPAADMKGVLKTRKVEHRPAISKGELTDFLKNLDSYSGDPVTKLALRLIVLTFVRTGELRGARWEEFDVDQGEWRIPAERMKMRSPHIVPLSPQALAVIEELRPLTGQFDLLFPSQRNQRKSISENTLLYALYRLDYHKRATVHGFHALAHNPDRNRLPAGGHRAPTRPC
jgi:integrase